MQQTLRASFGVALISLAVMLLGDSTALSASVFEVQDEVSGTNADSESVEDALNFIRNGRIDRGTIILQRLAGEGNAESLYHLGEMYRLGIGREKANSVATMYYRLATALNHKTASLSLANMLFFEGDGSDETIGEALGVWQNLAIEGNAESIYMLGMIYWNGEAGLERDVVRGYGLVWRASQSGYSDAVQNELVMRSLLNAETRDAAMEFGRSISDASFGEKSLSTGITVASALEETVDTPEEDNEAIVAAAEPNPAVPAEDNRAAEQPEEGAPPKANDQPAGETSGPPTIPGDWSSVWRLEVGFAMSRLDVTRLQTVINTSQAAAVGALASEVTPSATRPGLYRLTYGPMKSMHQAVNVCVTLKRAGHDCSAKPPEE